MRFSAARAAAAVLSLLAGTAAHAVEINLSKVTCQHYQDDILHPPPGAAGTGAVDPIDTTMWLLGFSVGKAGEHVMYGDALESFGFALDAECRNNPSEALLHAVSVTKVKQDHPMDLQRLTCAAWSKSHADLKLRDAESANTLTMWLYGFAAATHNVQQLQSAAQPAFSATLEGYCDAHTDSSMFDALAAITPPGATPDKPRPRAAH